MGGCVFGMKVRLLSIPALLCPSALSGPILGKELRVAARRRRHYALRSVYLISLMVFMLLVWSEVMSSYDGSAFWSAEMSETGKMFVTLVTWFQFIYLQIVTVVLLSNAISEEVQRRTLGVLMTTPITSLQIVMGKIFSKLLLLFGLFALSVPLLILMRVFGGIPWGYLISSWCITLTAILFLGSLTLLYSIYCRHAYTVMILTGVTVGILWGLVPVSLAIVGDAYGGEVEDVMLAVLLHICPYATLIWETDSLIGNSGWWAPPFYCWPVGCALTLIVTAALLPVACSQVRKAAMQHLVARSRRSEVQPSKTPHGTKVLRRPLFLHSLIRQTIGAGMLWKEFLVPVLGRWRLVVYAGGLSFAVLLILVILLTIAWETIVPFAFLFTSSVVGLLILAVLFTLTVPAACITREKESRSWESLMTTCLTDGQIFGGKIVGVLRRIILIWLPSLIVLLPLWYVANGSLIVLLQMGVPVIIGILVLISSGMYFSARMRRSTPAVLANLAFVGFLWVLVPFAFWQMSQSRWLGRDVWFLWGMYLPLELEKVSRFIWNATPIGLGTSMLEALEQDMRGFREFYRHRLETYLPICVGVNLVLAAILFWRARANLRRHIT